MKNKTSKTQTLEEFYAFKFGKDAPRSDNGAHFNVFRTEEYNNPNRKLAPYSKKVFYKISLIRGEHIFHYAEKSFRISGTTLMFFNPLVPYQVESISERTTGFFCIFSDSFLTESLRPKFKQMPMFTPGGKPAYILDKDSELRICDIYERMLLEVGTDYPFKNSLLGNFVTELIHYSLKLSPSEVVYTHPNAKQRIMAAFTELLERQFTIERPGQPAPLRAPAQFAAQLAVHVNHLNSAAKNITGKTTSSLIAERIVAEAKLLLKYTNWNISEIGFALGFEDPAHFNNFFRRIVHRSPSSFRTNHENEY